MRSPIKFLVVCLMPLGGAMADEPSAQSCTHIADNMARLACYDAALGVAVTTVPPQPAKSASPAGAPIAQPAGPTPSVKTPQDAFGDTGNLQKKPEPVSPKRLTATVDKAVRLGQGYYRLTLDNGQVWQTTQADPAVVFESRSSVIISRTMMGNYLISRTGQGNTLWVKRIQ
jgi:hypothetical protein